MNGSRTRPSVPADDLILRDLAGRVYRRALVTSFSRKRNSLHCATLRRYQSCVMTPAIGPDVEDVGEESWFIPYIPRLQPRSIISRGTRLRIFSGIRVNLPSGEYSRFHESSTVHSRPRGNRVISTTVCKYTRYETLFHACLPEFGVPSAILIRSLDR